MTEEELKELEEKDDIYSDEFLDYLIVKLMNEADKLEPGKERDDTFNQIDMLVKLRNERTKIEDSAFNEAEKIRIEEKRIEDASKAEAEKLDVEKKKFILTTVKTALEGTIAVGSIIAAWKLNKEGTGFMRQVDILKPLNPRNWKIFN